MITDSVSTGDPKLEEYLRSVFFLCAEVFGYDVKGVKPAAQQRQDWNHYRGIDAVGMDQTGYTAFTLKRLESNCMYLI